MFNGGDKISKGSQQLIKETNIKGVFKLISSRDGISRAEIANRTGLSPTTVSSLAEELISAGFIFEDGTGNIPTSGRKPIMLKVNPKGGCIIVADLQDNGYNLGLFDLNCCSVAESFISLPKYDDLGNSLVEEIKKATKKNGFLKKQLLGICIGAPGIIDRKNNKIISSTIIPIDVKNDFYTVIQKAYPDIKPEIVNESSLSAYAEKEYGKTMGKIDNLIYIDIHTGIGAGIIINGSMYEGSGSLAGEIGHMSVDINGPHCKCGSRGCLEILASIPSLIADIEQDTGFPPEFPNAGSIDERFKIIAGEYIENGGFSDEIQRMAAYIAYGINNAVNLINPEIVVIGGKAVELGNKFLREVQKTMNIIGLDGNKDIPIQLSEFKSNPVTAGGARHIFNQLF